MQKDSNVGPNPSGLCMCGCGQPTKPAAYTSTAKGWVKGKPLRFIHRHQKRGSESHAWARGRRTINGRDQLYVGKSHPMANTQRYVAEHRLVMAAKIGRPLLTSEHVHHINCDRTDNRPDNLTILSASTHKRLHILIGKGMSPLEALAQVTTKPDAA